MLEFALWSVFLLIVLFSVLGLIGFGGGFSKAPATSAHAPAPSPAPAAKSNPQAPSSQPHTA